MSVRLPSRYEDLDIAFRGRLRPDQHLIDMVQQAYKSMLISGGLRFLPLYGRSGSGKSSAVRELATHLPECRVVELTRTEILSEPALVDAVTTYPTLLPDRDLTIAVVDQYEESVAEQTAVPSQFVERLSLLDQEEEVCCEIRKSSSYGSPRAANFSSNWRPPQAGMSASSSHPMLASRPAEGKLGKHHRENVRVPQQRPVACRL